MTAAGASDTAAVTSPGGRAAQAGASANAVQAGVNNNASTTGVGGNPVQGGMGASNAAQAGGASNAVTGGASGDVTQTPQIGRERTVRPGTVIPAAPRTRQSDTGIGTRRASGVSGAINRNRGGAR